MPAARSSSGASGSRKRGASARGAASKSKRGGSRSSASPSRIRSGLAEQLVNALIRPLGLILLTRERIEEVLDDAAERGRVTRHDANELVLELVKRGRQQTDELLRDLVSHGRGQLGSATKRVRKTGSVDRIVRGADRARRTVGVGPSFPILEYDELTAGQVEQRLGDLRPAELRKVRDYERRHANRKSVLDAIERALR